MHTIRKCTHGQVLVDVYEEDAVFMLIFPTSNEPVNAPMALQVLFRMLTTVRRRLLDGPTSQHVLVARSAPQSTSAQSRESCLAQQYPIAAPENMQPLHSARIVRPRRPSCSRKRCDASSRHVMVLQDSRAHCHTSLQDSAARQCCRHNMRGAIYSCVPRGNPLRI